MIRALAAVTAAPLPRARLFLRATPRASDRHLVAAQLATGFRPGDERDPAMRAAVLRLTREARRAIDALAATVDSRRLDACVDRAVALQQSIVAIKEDDRACVGVAVVRALLEDAPDRCVDLDRAVRDAARLHGHSLTAEHEATAASLIGGVL